MEPGHEDREYVGCPTAALHLESASMEPGHEDREYLGTAYFVSPDLTPQWSPVMKTGNTCIPQTFVTDWNEPQWSPVMKTGNTSTFEFDSNGQHVASMEPGHEDREYREESRWCVHYRSASMEPGHEDREYLLELCIFFRSSTRLNGARS